MAEYIPTVLSHRVHTTNGAVEKTMPFMDDKTPPTELEVKLLTLAMQEIILAEANARGWRDMSIMSHPNEQQIDFRAYKGGISVQAGLDVRILRHVEARNLKGVLMDHAKGLLDMIYGRENLSAIEKRRIEREEWKAQLARTPPIRERMKRMEEG